MEGARLGEGKGGEERNAQDLNVVNGQGSSPDVISGYAYDVNHFMAAAELMQLRRLRPLKE